MFAVFDFQKRVMRFLHLKPQLYHCCTKIASEYRASVACTKQSILDTLISSFRCFLVVFWSNLRFISPASLILHTSCRHSPPNNKRDDNHCRTNTGKREEKTTSTSEFFTYIWQFNKLSHLLMQMITLHTCLPWSNSSERKTKRKKKEKEKKKHAYKMRRVYDLICLLWYLGLFEFQVLMKIFSNDENESRNVKGFSLLFTMRERAAFFF